jgi:transcriptional repressor NF-X1
MSGGGSQPRLEAQSSAPQTSSPGNRGRGRGRRRGHGRDATVGIPAGEASAAPAPPSSTGRQNRRGRGAAPRGGDSVPGTTRTFGGRLTVPEDARASTSRPAGEGLNADAPEFVPGQPVAIRK